MVAIDECGAACVIYNSTDEIKNLLRATGNDSFIIDNKYFTITVKLLLCSDSSDSSTNQTPETDLPINAVIVNTDFNILQSISKNDFFISADVKLFIGPRPNSEQFQFCIENQIEVLDLEDEPERLLEALESSVWPNAQMKSRSNPSPANNPNQTQTSPITSPPTQNENTSPPTLSGLVEMGALRDEIDHLSSLEDDLDADFSSILTLVNRVRAQGQNVSDTERRANAEHVISAIYNMLGDEYDSD